MIDKYQRKQIDLIFDGGKIEVANREYLYKQIEDFIYQYEKLKASGYSNKTGEHIKRVDTLVKHILEAQRIGMIDQDIRIEPPLAKQDNINRLYAGLKKFLDDESIKDIIRQLTDYKTIEFYTGSSFKYLTPYVGFINSKDSL